MPRAHVEVTLMYSQPRSRVQTSQIHPSACPTVEQEILLAKKLPKNFLPRLHGAEGNFGKIFEEKDVRFQTNVVPAPRLS